jgi:hypothetical protein
LEAEISEGGTVDLMDGRHLSLDDAIEDNDIGYEIQNEITEVIQECMNYIIYPRTAMTVTINYVEI